MASLIGRVGLGVSLIVCPILLVIGFASHPNLLRPRVLKDLNKWVARFHHNRVLHFGHLAVVLAVPLITVSTLYLTEIAKIGPLAWVGMLGGAFGLLGATALAVDKGALCLVPSAFDTLPEDQFARLAPGLAAMWAKKSYLIVVWGVLLLPAGFILQAVALLSAGTLPSWQSVSLLVGSLLFLSPDGYEIGSTLGAVLVAVALVPLGLKLLG